MQNPGGAVIDTCAGSSAPSCRFRNSPVRVEKRVVRLPGRQLPFFPTVEELEFLDVNDRSWVAPPRTLTDGASIPRVFHKIIGNPTSREFANAAAIHDAYCGVGNEEGPMFQTAEWLSVHRMFYDALRVGGTPEIKAKIMYAAVYIAGPRWDGVRRQGDSVARDATPGWLAFAGWRGQEPSRDVRPTAAGNRGLSPEELRRVLRRTIEFIEGGNPTLPQIEAFAEASLARMRSQQQAPGEAEAGQRGGRAQAAGPAPAPAPAPTDPGPGDPTVNDPTLGDPATGTPTAGDPAAGDPSTAASTAPAI